MKKLIYGLLVFCFTTSFLKAQRGPNESNETSLNHICGFSYWYNLDPTNIGSPDGTCETSHGILTPSSVCDLTVCCYNNFAIDQLTFGQPFYTGVYVSASGPNGPYANYFFNIVPGGGPTVVPFNYGPGVTYTLTLGGNSCHDLIITPLCEPPGTYTLAPNPVCVGQPVCLTFTTNMTVITSYSTVAPAQTQNCQANSFNNFTCFHCKTYTSPGIYTSTLSTKFWPVLDPDGKCNASKILTITVTSPLGPVTIIGTPALICRGETTQLTANAIGATGYTWMPGNITGNVINVNPLNTTTYTVYASNGGGCAPNSQTVTVTVGECCLKPSKNKPVVNLSNVTIVGPGQSPTVWGSLGSGPVYSGLISVPFSNYQITGNYNVSGSLTINYPVTFLNTRVAFDEAAQVDQNATTIIDKSYWHGCTKNWQGIMSKKGLSVTNSVIEDAYYAVWINATANMPMHPGLNIDNTIFNKNYGGISLLGYKLNSIKITGSIFTSRDIPVSNYVYMSGLRWTTLTNFNSVALTGYPIGYLKGSQVIGLSPTGRGQLGVFLSGAQAITQGNNQGIITVGDISNGGGNSNALLTNVFDYLRVGVFSFSSRIALYNNLFQNIYGIKGIDPNTSSACFYNNQSKAIAGNNINGPQAQLYKNTCLNSEVGIYGTTNGTLSIANNQFTNISQKGIQIEKWYAAANNNQQLTITNNNFNTCLIDFYAYDNSKIDVNFSDNVSTYPFITLKPRVTYHVFIDEINKSKDAKYSALFNNSVGKVNGVYCTNAYGAKINNNTITVRSPLTGGFNSPIWLDNTDQSDIKVNTLNVNPSQSQNFNTFGIFTNISVNNTYCENDIKGAGSAMKFQGSCPSKIYRNYLNNNPTDPCILGIFLDQSGFVGPINYPLFGNLIATANNQFGDFNVADTYLQNNSSPSQIDYQGSPNSGNIYYPSVNIPPPPFGMQPVSNNFSGPTDCGALQQLFMQNLSRGIPPFLTYQLNFGSNTANTNAIAAKGIFELFRKGAINTTSINGAPAFMAANTASAIGRFHKMDSLVYNYVVSGDTSKIGQAMALNTALSPNSNIEQNQKDFNTIYHTYLLGDTLVTSIQLNTLKGLAALCPFTDGTNVYQARALLRHYDTTEYFNACEFSIPSFSSSRFGNTATELNNLPQALNTKLFPNPASTEVTITTDIENAQLFIYNIVGQLMLESTLTTETQVDISTFKNGTYLYKIVKDRNIIKTDKLIINK